VVIQTCNDIGGPGGGALVFHSGNNAFPDGDAYNEVIGLGWRKNHQGDVLTTPRLNRDLPDQICLPSRCHALLRQ
jgi:hypothetical protein